MNVKSVIGKMKRCPMTTPHFNQFQISLKKSLLTITTDNTALDVQVLSPMPQPLHPILRKTGHLSERSRPLLFKYCVPFLYILRVSHINHIHLTYVLLHNLDRIMMNTILFNKLLVTC